MIVKNYLSFSKVVDCIIISVFIILSLFLLFNHEPWRDEAQAWLIVRDSPNISSLIRQMGYEGTPALWHFILFPLVKLGLPYFSMAILHFLIMLTAVIIFINYAPFSKFQKILFVFGYYILYEYNIIARSYVLSILFLFLIASIYKERFKKPLLYSLLMLFLANTNVFGLVMVIILGLVYFFDLYSKKIFIKKKYIIFSLILISGLLISLYQLLPPPDLTPRFKGWTLNFSQENILRIPSAIIVAFLPISIPEINFWNTNLLTFLVSFFILILFFFTTTYIKTLFPLLIFITAGGLFFLSLIFFLKKQKIILIYLFSSLGVLGILFLKELDSSFRWCGLIFIFFIFSLWIANEYNEKKTISEPLCHSRKTLNYLFNILLFIQVIASITPFYYELNYDFSAAKMASTFLKENNFVNKETFIATFQSSAASAILPYIPKPYSQFYYLEYNDYHSFLIWNKEYFPFHFKYLSIDEIIKRVDVAVANKNYDNVLLILNKTIEKNVEKTEKFSNIYNLIAYFNETIVSDESFYIYQLKR